MNSLNNKFGVLDSFYRDRIKNSFTSNPLKAEGLKLKSALTVDTVSFTSLTNPTLREKQEIAEIEKLHKKGLTNQIREKTKDISTLVRLKAYDSIKNLSPFQYTNTERKRLEKAKKLAMADIKKHENGKNIQGFIKDLEKQGFKFYFADDTLPEDLWTDEDFLDQELRI